MVALPLTRRRAAGSSEADRLTAAAAGDPAALRWLLDEVAPIVYGYVYARVGGNAAAAEDLLQETLLEAVRSASTFRGDALLSTWMCAIARKRLARHYEQERQAALGRSRLRVVAETVVDDSLAHAEQREEVAQALGRLPALHRQVLVLKYLDEMSVEEISELVGRSRVQVQSLLQRAREGLRRELGGDDA